MKNNKVVKVFNRNTFAVFAKGINRGYKFEAAQGGRAASIPLAWEDIEYINDNTELFREGYLSFSDTESAELHKELGNFNIEKTAYTPERIRDAILNPTYDKMKAIIDTCVNLATSLFPVMSSALSRKDIVRFIMASIVPLSI